MTPASNILAIRTSEDATRGVQLRIAELGALESPPPLELRIEADLTAPAQLVWGNLEESPTLDISVDGGGHRLSGVRLRLEGRRVRVRGLRMDGAGGGGQLLELVGAEEIQGEDLVLTHTAEARTTSGARTPVGALKLVAGAPGARAQVRDVLLLDHPSSGAVRVAGRGGSAGFADVTWERGRAAAVGLPLFELGVVSVFSAPETRVMGTGEVVRAMPATVVLEVPAVVPEDASLLAEWRAEAGR